MSTRQRPGRLGRRAVRLSDAGPEDSTGQRPGRAGRRAVLLSGASLAAGAAAASAGWALSGSSATAPASPNPATIAPDDDLMREHGVLKRVLLCYQEMTARVQAGKPLDARDVQNAALIIHDYIEGFHEGLEEGYVFPRLIKARRVTGTVTTLLVQHARGRVITQFLLSEATARGVASPGTRAQLAAAMQAFDRMYQPHEAREDTVIFPAFRQIVPAGELADLGQHFADLEHQQFGTNEFTAMVGRVTSIEQNLGIYDLAQFTPQVTQYAPPA
jgi:hemerythrin-like domain-containing protein